MKGTPHSTSRLFRNSDRPAFGPGRHEHVGQHPVFPDRVPVPPLLELEIDRRNQFDLAKQRGQAELIFAWKLFEPSPFDSAASRQLIVASAGRPASTARLTAAAIGW